jgi:hypothetical protein
MRLIPLEESGSMIRKIFRTTPSAHRAADHLAGQTHRPGIILLSHSRRPWDREKVSLISAALTRCTGGHYSHASIDIDGMTYGFRTTGFEIRPREIFDSNAFKVFEVGSCLADADLLRRTIEDGASYDWKATFRVAAHRLSGLPSPVEELRPLYYTCTSFVAAVCRLYMPGTNTINRYMTALDIEKQAGVLRPTGGPFLRPRIPMGHRGVSSLRHRASRRTAQSRSATAARTNLRANTGDCPGGGIRIFRQLGTVSAVTRSA